MNYNGKPKVKAQLVIKQKDEHVINTNFRYMLLNSQNVNEELENCSLHENMHIYQSTILLFACTEAEKFNQHSITHHKTCIFLF